MEKTVSLFASQVAKKCKIINNSEAGASHYSTPKLQLREKI
jgi:hypothetical protein